LSKHDPKQVGQMCSAQNLHCQLILHNQEVKMDQKEVIQITLSKRKVLALIAALLIGGSLLATSGQAVPLQAQRSPLPTPTRQLISITLETILLSNAERFQVIQFNPGAALQKVIFADGFVPNSGEFSFQQAGTKYVGQRAEELATGEVRIYFVVEGDWRNVQYAVRP